MILLDDIYVYLNEDMPNSIAEAVSPNADGTYTILLNKNLSSEMQHKAFWHAVKHIERNDFERVEKFGVQAIESDAHDLERGDAYANCEENEVGQISSDHI